MPERSVEKNPFPDSQLGEFKRLKAPVGVAAALAGLTLITGVLAESCGAEPDSQLRSEVHIPAPPELQHREAMPDELTP